MYPCHRRVRHFVVEVDHFCSYGVATHPIRCRDITKPRFWSWGTHRFFTPRKIKVSNCTTPTSDPVQQVDSKLLCVVVPLQWVQRTFKRARTGANVSGGGGATFEAEFDVRTVETQQIRRPFFANDVMGPGGVWETHIPTQMGSSVGLILARIDEDGTTARVKLLTQYFVEVGQRVDVTLPRVDTRSSTYPTMGPGIQDVVTLALEAAMLRDPNVTNPADPFHSPGGSSTTAAGMSSGDSSPG